MTNTRAEELMAAYLSGNIAAAEREELLAWVAASPDGKKFFDHAVTLWDLTEQMAYPDFSANKQMAWGRLEQRLPAEPKTKQATKIRRLGTRTWWTAAAAIALLLTLGWWWMQPAASASVFVSTENEERQELTLPDGTQVWLNENTTLSYASVAGERQIQLSGEAFFDVATDSLQPFHIYTEQSVTTVLGTSFNIRAYPAEEQVEVSVREGKVALARKPVDTSTASAEEAEKIELLPGDKGVFVKATAIITKEQEQAKNSTAWKDGLLDFAGVPLGEVVKVIERYYDVNIELSNPGLERCLFYGTYDHPSLEDLLRAIEFSSELKLEENNGTYRFSGEGCE